MKIYNIVTYQKQNFQGLENLHMSLVWFSNWATHTPGGTQAANRGYTVVHISKLRYVTNSLLLVQFLIWGYASVSVPKLT